MTTNGWGNCRLTDASMDIEGWGEYKAQYMFQYADELIEEYNLTLDDVKEIEQFQCIGGDDDEEIIYWIKQELQERLDNENQT